MNSNSHGECDMARALALSCNTYFVALSKQISGSSLRDQAELLGFGSEIKLAPNISSAMGSLPTREQLKTSGEKANFAFGQGSLTASPLQVASMMQTVCNGGRRIIPTLVKSVTKDGNAENFSPTAPVIAMTDEIADTIKNWLYNAVENGTGSSAKVVGLKIGGKTATAETSDKSDTWFVGFCDDYDVSIAVVCENGTSGSKDAAPIFKNILEIMKK